MKLAFEEIARAVTYFVQIKTHAPGARWETYGRPFDEYAQAKEKQEEITRFGRYAETRIRRRTQLDEVIAPKIKYPLSQVECRP